MIRTAKSGIGAFSVLLSSADNPNGGPINRTLWRMNRSTSVIGRSGRAATDEHGRWRPNVTLMQPTSHPNINTLLTELVSEMEKVLGEKLVGLYLYGSLVTGDFDDDISDIDLLAVTSAHIDAND